MIANLIDTMYTVTLFPDETAEFIQMHFKMGLFPHLYNDGLEQAAARLGQF